MTEPTLEPSATPQDRGKRNEPQSPEPTTHELPSTQIPVSEIPSEVKSLEELSGVKESANEIIQETSSLPPEMQPTSAPAEIHATDDSRAKIVKIVVPIVVAIALGLGGFLVYSFFIKGDAEEATPAEEPVTEKSSIEMGTAAEESTIEEKELEQSLNEAAEKAAKEASEGAPEAPADSAAEGQHLEPVAPKVKVPRT